MANKLMKPEDWSAVIESTKRAIAIKDRPLGVPAFTSSTGKIVSITTFKDRLIVATDSGIYRLDGEELVPIRFQQSELMEPAPPVDLTGSY